MTIEHNLSNFELSEQDCLLVQGGTQAPSSELFLLLELTKENLTNEIEKPTTGVSTNI
jgi:hypothetical protein